MKKNPFKLYMCILEIQTMTVKKINPLSVRAPSTELQPLKVAYRITSLKICMEEL